MMKETAKELETRLAAEKAAKARLENASKAWVEAFGYGANAGAGMGTWTAR